MRWDVKRNFNFETGLTSGARWNFKFEMGHKNHFNQVKELLSRSAYDAPMLWLNPDKKLVQDFEMKDIKLINYRHHGTIKAPVAV